MPTFVGFLHQLSEYWNCEQNDDLDDDDDLDDNDDDDGDDDGDDDYDVDDEDEQNEWKECVVSPAGWLTHRCQTWVGVHSHLFVYNISYTISCCF